MFNIDFRHFKSALASGRIPGSQVILKILRGIKVESDAGVSGNIKDAGHPVQEVWDQWEQWDNWDKGSEWSEVDKPPWEK